MTKRLLTKMALATLLSAALPAEAASIVFQTKGGEGKATLVVEEIVTCASGTRAPRRTFVEVQVFQDSIRASGDVTGSSFTVLQVMRFDGCTGDTVVEFGTFTGNVLQMSSLNSGTLTGHFVLDTITVDLNLTLTGGSGTEHFMRTERDSMGTALIIRRFNGFVREATVGGTLAINGRPISFAQVISADGSLARSSGGQVTILKP